MKLVQAPRASAILYHLLNSQREKRPWLLPANICPIVPITFLKAGVPFQLVDISEATLHIDQDQVESRVKTQNYGGLLYAHTYGEASRPNEFFSTIKDIAPELIIVDDRCLCLPDLTADVDNMSDVELYSTGYAKVVELNVGGYAFLGDHVDYQLVHRSFDPHAHERIENAYKDAIKEKKKFIYQDGDWLETETIMPPWPDYQKQIETNLATALNQRERLNDVYAQILPKEIQLPRDYQNWRFNILVNDKQSCLDAIFSAGLFASSHYASLAGIMDDGQAPHAEDIADHVINLFNDHHFTLSQAEQVCTIILENVA